VDLCYYVVAGRDELGEVVKDQRKNRKLKVHDTKQSAQEVTQKDRAKIIGAIKKLGPERHINVRDPNQDYSPWIAAVDEPMPRLIGEHNQAAFGSKTARFQLLGCLLRRTAYGRAS
jgi:hypothetical protein